MNPTEKNVQFSSLILAPLLLGISTFYWQNGEYSVNAATLLTHIAVIPKKIEVFEGFDFF